MGLLQIRDSLPRIFAKKLVQKNSQLLSAIIDVFQDLIKQFLKIFETQPKLQIRNDKGMFPLKLTKPTIFLHF